MKYTPKVVSQCPFYDHEYISSINCEGFAGASENVMKFESEELKLKHQLNSCCKSKPTECALYITLMKKYE